MTSSSPLRELIGNRCQELDLTAPDLIRRAGYQNLAKGLRRLQALRNGDLETTKGLMRRCSANKVTPFLARTASNLKHAFEGLLHVAGRPVGKPGDDRA